MSKVELKVNGQSHSVDVDPATPLLCVLATIWDCRGRGSGAASGNAVRAR
jgi:aerobic-type carbon monoxide dehydrogenase small subunit (CoxS/CutS family)